MSGTHSVSAQRSWRVACTTITRANCPFHDDPGGTLYIYSGTPNDMFHCFGCGVRGGASQKTNGDYELVPEAIGSYSWGGN